MTSPLSPSLPWILDAPLHERMRERSCGRPSLASVLTTLGYPVFLAKLDNGTMVWDTPPPPPGPAILHGQFPFVLHARALGYVEPFPTCEDTAFDSLTQKAWLGSKLLNADMTLTTLGQLRQDPIPSVPVFLRPVDIRIDGLKKAFPGKPLQPKDWSGFLNGLVEQGLPDSLGICQSPFQHLHAEARHLIVDGKLVTSSLYRFEGALHCRIDTYPEQRALARSVARKRNQPALAYTCDTAIVLDTDGTRSCKVVELNPFSSSGFYGLDTAALVHAFTTAITKDRS